MSSVSKTDFSTNVKQWVLDYADALYSWAYYKTSQKEAAEDLVQETFLAALKHIGRFEGKSTPKTWLFSILNNKIIDYHRRNFKSILQFDNDLGINDRSSILELLFDEDGHWKKKMQPQKWEVEEAGLLDNEDFVGELQKCMDKLPTTWNSALQLKYLEEKEGVEICQELGISPSNFWQMVHRSKLQLRQCLEKHWFMK